MPVALADFGRFCAELKVEDGGPFKLHPFQRLMLTDYFEGVRETVLIIPKKNGKSTLLAALALYHLLVTDNAECIMVAASREQAEIILRQARMFVRSSEALGRVMRIQQRSILSNLDEGRIRVLASDEDTADGTIPTLAIVDELHRHKTADLYGVLRDGLGPRKGQIITISTAASSLDSPLGKLRQRAYDLGVKRDGKHNYVRSGSLAFHEWCLDPSDDTTNLRVVKQANPAPWTTIAILAERQESATPAQWLRFACGIWTEAEDPWLPAEVWDSLAGEVEVGPDVLLAVKVRGSAAAIVGVSKREGRLDVWSHIWSEGASGEVIEAKLRELCGKWNVAHVLYDPWAFKRSAELLEAEGLPMLDFPNSAERMAQASASLARLVEADQLRHDGNPDLRAQVLAGTWKDSERGRRLVEDPTSHRPVDALIALAAAVHVAGVPTRPGEVMVAWV